MSTQSKRRIAGFLQACLLALVVFLAARSARAAVDLLYFQGETELDRIFLEWETGTELDNAGFIVLRSETGGTNPDNYEGITVIDAVTGDPYTFIPARGDSLVGAYYPFYDEDVTIGTPYYYFLQDVDTSNISSYHGPIMVVAGQTPTPTLAVTATRTNTPSATSPAGTATPTRTRTPTPTRTPTGAAVVISLTPFRTNTPSPSPIPPSTLEPPTPTFDPQVSDFDRTLTAVYEAVTGVPTDRPPKEIAGLPPATAAAATLTSPPATEPESPGPLTAGRLIPIILVVLASGGLLTWGVLLIARRSGDAQRRPDEP